MKKAKSILVILVILALAVFTLTACGNDKENGGDAPVCEHRDADDNSLCDKCGEAFVDGVDIAESSEGLEFELNEDGETYTVTGIGTCTDSDIIICLYNGAPVTGIGDNAFYQCYGLTSVTIGNSVTSIGKAAFYDCRTLASVTIGNGVTSIGSGAFSGCYRLKYNEYDNAYYLGSENNPYLALIEAKDTSITSCEINSNTKVICYGAFEFCRSLTSIVIPDSVTSIGQGAFERCTGLTSVAIGNDVTSIGAYAFDGCTALTSVTIPDSVTSIGGWAFYGCDSLKYNEYDNAYYLGSENNPYLALVKAKDTSITSCEINSNTKVICYDAFLNCTSLTSIVIPDGVTSIGYSAFSGCTSLKSVTIGNGVTSIGVYAFSGCTALTSVTIPDSVKIINGSAFEGCTAITSILIPDSVTRIGTHAFEGCTNLTSIVIPDSVTSIGSDAFSYCQSLTIYCEATSLPTSWSVRWNSDHCPVEWGYTGEQAEA